MRGFRYDRHYFSCRPRGLWRAKKNNYARISTCYSHDTYSVVDLLYAGPYPNASTQSLYGDAACVTGDSFGLDYIASVTVRDFHNQGTCVTRYFESTVRCVMKTFTHRASSAERVSYIAKLEGAGSNSVHGDGVSMGANSKENPR